MEVSSWHSYDLGTYLSQWTSVTKGQYFLSLEHWTPETALAGHFYEAELVWPVGIAHLDTKANQLWRSDLKRAILLK